MKYPHFLPEGGTIGFVAPSFGAFIEPYHTIFKNTLKTFDALGYRALIGPNVYEGSGIGISSTPENCGKELMDFYASPDSDILISVGGGELMCETISHVDFNIIRASEPKWFTGYSDNTNFGFLLATLCDTASLYAPCAAEYGMETWHPSVSDTFNVLTGKNLTVHGYDFWESEKMKSAENPLAPYNATEPTVVQKWNWNHSSVSGRFIGGCLDVLTGLVGTRFDHVKEFQEKYVDDGIIWFLEACDLNVFGIRRALWNLKEAGWFKNVKAFVIGRPLLYGQDMMGLNQYEAVLGPLREFNVPIFMDADLGHLPPMMPMINGGYGTLSDYGENNIQIQFELR